MIKIAVDAMGGDHAPATIVAGVELAVAEFDDLFVSLYGDRDLVQQFMTSDHPRIKIIHVAQGISEYDNVFDMIRKGQTNSLGEAMQAVADGTCDCYLSAGPTGASYVAALQMVTAIEGIERPPIAAILATINPDSPYFYYLDGGANPDAKANHLLDYAIIGAFYAKELLGVDKVRIGLLSNGTEPGKGNRLHKQAFKLLSQLEAVDFVGNVEPHGLLDGIVDVLVTDGFSGNIYLKAYEDMMATSLTFLEQQMGQEAWVSDQDQQRFNLALQATRLHFDSAANGGYQLMGVKRPVFMAHGRSNAQDIYNSLAVARQSVNNQVNEQLISYYRTHARKYAN